MESRQAYNCKTLLSTLSFETRNLSQNAQLVIEINRNLVSRINLIIKATAPDSTWKSGWRDKESVRRLNPDFTRTRRNKQGDKPPSPFFIYRRQSHASRAIHKQKSSRLIFPRLRSCGWKNSAAVSGLFSLM
jgi:hypothetical protein